MSAIAAVITELELKRDELTSTIDVLRRLDGRTDQVGTTVATDGRTDGRISRPKRAVARRAAAPARRVAADPNAGDFAAGVVAHLEKKGPRRRKELCEHFNASVGKMNGVLEALARVGRVHATGVRFGKRYHSGPARRAAKEAP